MYDQKAMTEVLWEVIDIFLPSFLSQPTYFVFLVVKATLGSFFELSAASCQEIKNSSGGPAPSGRYWLKGESENKPFIAYCDMERGGRSTGFSDSRIIYSCYSFLNYYVFFSLTVIVECTGNPCQNGGTCDYQGEGQYACQCSQGYRGRNCELGKIVSK